MFAGTPGVPAGTGLASASLKTHGVPTTAAQPMSIVPWLRGRPPTAFVVNWKEPYGETQLYGVFGHRPLLAVNRIRVKVIWSPKLGAPSVKVPSRATRIRPVPGVVVPLQPSSVTMSESATA